MEIYRIGSKIREERIRQKLSQEELSYGICAVSTLSRIETGMQKPGLKMEEALLERLGCSTENLVFFASEEEAMKHTLEVDIAFKLMRREEDLKKELEEYERLMEENGTSSNLENQYYLMVKATYDSYMHSKKPLQVYTRLKEAFLMTMPNFKAKELYAIRRMTLTEINILNNMAVALYEMKLRGLAMKYLYFLVDYLESSNFSKDVIVKKYPMLLVNLAKLETKMEDFEHVFSICQKGITFCKEYGRMVPLAEFYYYKAVACVRLGRKKGAIESYEYAICLLKIRNNNKLSKQIEEEYHSVFKYMQRTSECQQCQLADHHTLHKQTEEKPLSQPEEEQKTKSVLPA